MSFGFSLFATFFLLSLGGAFGCLVCMVFGAVFHKKVLKTRLTIFCLLLSVAVATVAFVLIFASALVSSAVPVARENLVFLSILFALGFLCAVFWRSVLPFAVVCYIALSVFTGVMLYGAFGANEDAISLTVSRSSVKAGDQTFPLTDGAEQVLVLRTYVLPSELLLPLPRVWYAVTGVVSAPVSEDSLPHEDAFSLSLRSSDTLWGKMQRAYGDWLLSRIRHDYIAIPRTAVYPSLYTATVQTRGEKLSYAIVRNL